MRKTRRSKSRYVSQFKITEPSLETLYRAREHMLLLASLCAARIRYDAHELELTPNALVNCFQRLANDVGEVLDETKWQIP